MTDGEPVRRDAERLARAVACRLEKLGRHVRAVLRAVRQLAGAPDYERYLEHHVRCHPDRPPLNRQAYYAEFTSWRFGNGASRCC